MSVQCGGAPGLCRAVESVSVNFVFVVIVLFPLFFFFSFSFHVCTSDVLEVLGYYVYPSICIAGSNSEVNNSLYNGGKWSRTMSGYIALNAISFSVCRPHKALNVDTLHISFVRIPSSRWFFCRTCWRASWIFCCSFSIFTFSCSHERSKREKRRLSAIPSTQHQTLVPPAQNIAFCVIVCVYRLAGQ